MTLTSTGSILSIFKDGKLKAGVYKIQNLYTEGYVDIHEYSRELCCRPAQDLREGRGIVGPDLYQWFASNDWKWEIKPLGAGYTIQRVSHSPQSLPFRALNNAKRRSNWGNPNSFVRRWSDSTTTVRFPSPLILWLGDLMWSTTRFIAASNTFGQNFTSLVLPERFSTPRLSIFWGTTKIT